MRQRLRAHQLIVLVALVYFIWTLKFNILSCDLLYDSGFSLNVILPGIRHVCELFLQTSEFLEFLFVLIVQIIELSNHEFLSLG